MPKAFYIFQEKQKCFNNQYFNINQWNIQLVLTISVCLHTFPRLFAFRLAVWPNMAYKCEWQWGIPSTWADQVSRMISLQVFSHPSAERERVRDGRAHMVETQMSKSPLEESFPEVLLDAVRFCISEWDFGCVKLQRALGYLYQQLAFIALLNHDVLCEMYL